MGANVVVELYSESHSRRPTTRAWAIIDGPTSPTGWPANASVIPTRRPADRTDGVDRIHQPQEREVMADAR